MCFVSIHRIFQRQALPIEDIEMVTIKDILFNKELEQEELTETKGGMRTSPTRPRISRPRRTGPCESKKPKPKPKPKERPLPWGGSDFSSDWIIPQVE